MCMKPVKVGTKMCTSGMQSHDKLYNQEVDDLKQLLP